MGWREAYQLLEAQEIATKATKGESQLEVETIQLGANKYIQDPLVQRALELFQGKVVEVCGYENDN